MCRRWGAKGQCNENDQTWLNCCIYLWFETGCLSECLSVCLSICLASVLAPCFVSVGWRPSGCSQPLWALIWSSRSTGFTQEICLGQIVSLSQHTAWWKRFLRFLWSLIMLFLIYHQAHKAPYKNLEYWLFGIINSCLYFYVHVVKYNKYTNVSDMTLRHLFASNFLASLAHLTRLSQKIVARNASCVRLHLSCIIRKFCSVYTRWSLTRSVTVVGWCCQTPKCAVQVVLLHKVWFPLQDRVS